MLTQFCIDWLRPKYSIHGVVPEEFKREARTAVLTALAHAGQASGNPEVGIRRAQRCLQIEIQPFRGL
jgi:hypothetical protein